MELMLLRSRPLAAGLLRPKGHRLPSVTSCHDSVLFQTKSASSSQVETSRRFLRGGAMPSSSMKVSATASVASASGAGKQEGGSLEKDAVFVAGSTGKVGSRLVRELLKLGFRVRAGVRSSQRAGALIQSVKQMKPADSTQATQERLEIVECDLENQSTIRSAIGSASIVMCCIGASEKEVFDITGPYRIDYKATSNLIQEATKLKVDHFILLTSLGTGQIGFPAALLNLFWGVLCWKRKAEEELIASGLPYTIVRPGGMERPTDTFKETHNLVLANEDTYFGGLVSNLQVAELMAAMAKNSRLSYCKVVEVIAETTAPLLPIEQLLSTIPSQRPLPPEPEPQPTLETKEPEPQPKLETKPEPIQASKPQPQSPYTAYEDLKPPSSPTPSMPIIEPKSTDSSPTPSTPIIEPKPLPPEPEPQPKLETKEPEPEPKIETKPEPIQASKPQPQSPYTAYEDLKPPSSPIPSTPIIEPKSTDSSPTPSTPIIEPKSTASSPTPSAPIIEPKSTDSSPTPSTPIIELKDTDSSSVFVYSFTTPNQASIPEADSLQVSKPTPQSAYTAYEDLKSPSSPTPSQPKTELESTASSSVDTQVSAGSTESLSPYPSYEDLKPPSSPSPSIPDNGTPISISASESQNSGPKAADKELDGIPEKPYPLSPYTMYEDLKPPSSPTPSAPKY